MNFASFTLAEMLTMQRALKQLRATDPPAAVSSLLKRLKEEIETRSYRIRGTMLDDKFTNAHRGNV